jgi:hypothetical protein
MSIVGVVPGSRCGWQSISKEGSLLKSLPKHLKGNNVDEQSTKPGTINHAIPALNTIAMHLTQTMSPCKMCPPYHTIAWSESMNHSASTINPDGMPTIARYRETPCNA